MKPHCCQKNAKLTAPRYFMYLQNMENVIHSISWETKKATSYKKTNQHNLKLLKLYSVNLHLLTDVTHSQKMLVVSNAIKNSSICDGIASQWTLLPMAHIQTLFWLHIQIIQHMSELTNTFHNSCFLKGLRSRMYTLPTQQQLC